MNVDVSICGPEFTQCKTCSGEKQDWMKGRSSLKSKNQRAALKKWKADSKRSLHQPLGVDTNIQPLAPSLPSRPATDLPTEWAESKHQSAEDQLGIGSNKSKQAAPRRHIWIMPPESSAMLAHDSHIAHTQPCTTAGFNDCTANERMLSVFAPAMFGLLAA